MIWVRAGQLRRTAGALRGHARRFRRSSYLRDVALPPPAAKELRVFGLGSRGMSSSRAFWSWATNCRDTEDLDVERACTSTSVPTGSLAARWGRVARPASIRSMTTADSTSSLAKVA
jgi:hypothetical protein